MTLIRAIVNENLCTGCGACMKVCSQGAITIQTVRVDLVPISGRAMVLKNKITTMEDDMSIVKGMIEKIKVG